ncbi:hypothetical protein [uncultured Chitinophaga sp.]|jgi:hypothetical protein|uniref:hypothetical protein n=1 Tax=uncultured Chitinophaga sp. TaxID=339340 RepID=UPI002629CAD4|nr:hypothetical protein [uncultured Chitinophaga sp.]
MKSKQPKPGQKVPREKEQADKPLPPKIDELEEKRDKTFPGYPVYPPGEDIMNRGEKEDLDVENLSRSDRGKGHKHSPQKPPAPDEEEGLDVPGAELDNSNEEIGNEDEENNFYSLGGDRHEDLEEDPS